MTESAGDPVLAVIVRTAVSATGASAGWLVAADDGAMRVIASTGSPGPSVSTTVPPDSGAAGFVLASGQPLAVAPRGGDRFSEGMVALLGHSPASILAVPCFADDVVVGVIELVDKAGGGSFSFDDVELATLLAGIAGVAVTSAAERPPDIPAPAQLGGDLARLATTDPGRYAGVASAVAALLSG